MPKSYELEECLFSTLCRTIDMKHSWKQKPEKPKDAATRNLTAELEAVATTTNAMSPKARVL